MFASRSFSLGILTRNRKIDINEEKEKNPIIAALELPGLNKENIFIDVHNNVLTVSGESKFESESKENGYMPRYRRFGRFSRSIPVPEGVKVSRFPLIFPTSLDN